LRRQRSGGPQASRTAASRSFVTSTPKIDPSGSIRTYSVAWVRFIALSNGSPSSSADNSSPSSSRRARSPHETQGRRCRCRLHLVLRARDLAHPRRAALHLVYLGNGESLRCEPDERDLLATERKLEALWKAIERATDSGDWRARKSALSAGVTTKRCAPNGAVRRHRCRSRSDRHQCPNRTPCCDGFMEKRIKKEFRSCRHSKDGVHSFTFCDGENPRNLCGCQ